MTIGAVREHVPPPGLRPWLECVWERDGRGARARILPDGCIDLVWATDSGTSVVGANTTAFLAGTARGERIVGARMRPGAAPVLIGVEPEAVRDQRVPIELVLGDEGARLTAMLAWQPDPAAALAVWLQARAARAERPDPLVTAAVASLPGCDRVTALARELAVSERALRRRVTSAVGYGPKRLGRILRLRRALVAARGGDELARVAFDAGYADQAHFSGECRELAGVPPSVLLAE
jgi:AraC-like DNA-binding protein